MRGFWARGLVLGRWLKGMRSETWETRYGGRKMKEAWFQSEVHEVLVYRHNEVLEASQ